MEVVGITANKKEEKDQYCARQGGKHCFIMQARDSHYLVNKVTVKHIIFGVNQPS